MNKKTIYVFPLISIILSGCQKNNKISFINTLPEGGNEVEINDDNISTYEEKFQESLKDSVSSISDGFNISIKCDLPSFAYVSEEQDNTFSMSLDNGRAIIDGSVYGLSGSPKEIEGYIQGSKINGDYCLNTKTSTYEGSFKNGGFSAYLFDNSVAFDLTDKGFTDGLLGIAKFVVNKMNIDYSEEDIVSLINMVSKKLRIKSLFDSDETFFPEISEETYETIGQTISYLVGATNIEDTITAKEYDDGYFGLQIAIGGEDLDELLSFDLSYGENVDYAKSNNSNINVIMLFDSETRLSTISLETSIDYEAKTYIAEDIEKGFEEYNKTFSFKANGNFEIDLSYDQKEIVYPDLSEYGVINISQFIK